MIFDSKSTTETEEFAKNFVEGLEPSASSGRLVGLSGELGAGKTAFVKAVAKALGVKEEITSPTFVILKRFTIHDSRFKNLIHIDAYRLEHPSELENLGWKQLLADPKNLILLEWPEKVADILPQGMIEVSFEYIDEKTRRIEFKN